MAREILSDELWAVVEPLLPPDRPPGSMGRPPVRNRIALRGILFVLKTGLAWEDFPQELGCSGMTLWRRLRDWNEQGVWLKLHAVLLQELTKADKIDWSRASLDSGSVPAPGGEKTGKNQTDRGKQGSKHHVVVDRHGTLLAVLLSPANTHDSKLFDELLDAVILVKTGRRGRPRKRPDKLHADKGYDYKRCRRSCRKRHIKPRIARRGVPTDSSQGKHRWVVERTISWLHRDFESATTDEPTSTKHSYSSPPPSSASSSSGGTSVRRS